MQSMSATKPRSMQRWRYVYAIIPVKKEMTFGPIGIQGENVHTLHIRDIAAVLSDARQKKYEILDYGIPHQEVLEKVMEHSHEYNQNCTIPMRFGQVATELDIKTFLSRSYPKLKMYFGKLDGKKELGLKVTRKIDPTIKEIAASNIKIRTMRQQIQGKPLEKTFHQRLELGTKISQELERRGDKIATDIFTRLSGTSAERKLNKNLSEEMILNAAFLVDKKKEQDFDQLVNTLEQEYGDLNMKYVIAPPFNFVNIRIKR